MQKTRVMLVALLVTMLPTDLWAAGTDAEIRVSGDGLAFVAARVPALLPQSVNIGYKKGSLLNCPIGGDSEIWAENITFKPTIKKLEIIPQTGKIKVFLALGGSGTAKAGVTKLGCITGSLTCNVSATLDYGEATAIFTPSIVNGQLKLTKTSVDLNVGDKAVNVNLSGCGIAGELIEKAGSWLRGWWVDALESWVEGELVKALPEIIEDKVGDMTSLGGSVSFPVGGVTASYDVSGTAKRVVSSSTGGLGVGIDVGIVSKKKAACYKALASYPTPTKTTTTPTFSFSGSEHLGVALSAGTLRQVVYTAWQSGLLCYSSARLKSLGLEPGMLTAGAILLGLTGIDTVKARAPRVPLVTLVTGSSARADLKMTGFEIVLEGSDAAGPTTITATANMTFKIKVDYNPFSGALVIDSFTTTIDKLSVGGGALDEQMFQQLLESVLVPMIDGELNGLKLLPHVAHQVGGFLDPYYLYVTRGKTTSSHIYVYGKIFDRPSSDSKAPTTTIIRKPASVVGPQIFRLLASGYDDQTPRKLVRFRWKVNSGSWGITTFGRGKELKLEDGRYTVEAKAVDLNNNTDATPAKVTFEVDGTSPTLTVDEVPKEIASSSLRVGYLAKDDHTSLTEMRVTYKLERDNITVLDSTPLPRGAKEMVLEGLADGEYWLTVIAEDKVGNLSEPEVRTFIVDGQGAPAEQPPPEVVGVAPPAGPPADGSEPFDVVGGCAVSGGAADGLPLGLLLLGLLLRRCSRRRR